MKNLNKKIRSTIDKPKVRLAVTLALVATGTLFPDTGQGACDYSGDEHAGDCEYSTVPHDGAYCTVGSAYNDCN